MLKADGILQIQDDVISTRQPRFVESLGTIRRDEKCRARWALGWS